MNVIKGRVDILKHLDLRVEMYPVEKLQELFSKGKEEELHCLSLASDG